MKTTICFTTSRSWSPVSWLIRKFTGSRVSHVALCVDIYGIPVMLHATMGGVQLTLRNRFEADNHIVEEFRFKPDMTIGVYHTIAQHLGDRFDYVGLLGHAYVSVVWKWLKRKRRNPLASPSALVCSEFVLHVDPTKQIEEWKWLDPERTTPQDLLDCCQLEINFERR